MFIHARFSPELLEWATALVVSLQNPRYIIAEEVGKKTEKLHYHTCFESHIGLEAIKKRFQTQCKALGLVSKKGQENAYYGGVKECTDPSYICKEGKYIATLGYTPEQLESLRIEGMTKYTVPIVANNGTKIEYIHVLPKKASTMRAKFVEMLVSENWDKNQTITVHNYKQKCDEIIDACTDFWENAFTTPQGAVMVEHAKWVFADDDIRDLIKENNRNAIKKCLR